VPGGTGGGGFGTPGPNTSGPLAGRYFSGKFTNAAGTRAFTGYVPSKYQNGTALPLVVALHGCTQSADTMAKQTKLNDLAEAKNFIVVYPEQPSSANQFSCWNWFESSDMQRGQGEPSIIAGITQWVQQNYTVDSKQTFVGGFSAGGAMAAVMGATYPDVYASLGIGSGIEYNGGTGALGGNILDAKQAGQAAYRAMGGHARVVPTLVFHGGKDKTVPTTNATYLIQQWQTTNDLADDGALNGSFPSAATSTQNLVSAGGQPYSVTSYGDGRGHEAIQYWLVANMAHAWSGGCSCTSFTYPSGPDEARAMYDFFVSHPMP
jgi:poly(hydroxyalkanoate) depolymerase family esterase